MMHVARLVSALALSLMAVAAPAQPEMRTPDPFYCEERRLGTWFYCDDTREAVEPPQAAPPPIQSSRQRLDGIGEQLEELRARAILQPSSENVAAYIRYQQEQLARAAEFADVWQRTVWQNPELDYTLERPVNSLARREWTRARTADREAALHAISQRYGVFYFFSSGCEACAVAAPIVKGVSDRFGLTVVAVSVDGGPSNAFPEYLVDTGQFEAMGLAQGGQVPALVLYDTVERRPVPIGFGIMAADDIMNRIYTLTAIEPGSDF